MVRFCPRCGQQQQRDEAAACPRDGTTLVPVGTHDLIGHPLGDYVVVASLGGGSFGRVYRAVHARSGAVVAVKLMQQPVSGTSPLADRSSDAHRVVREARAAAMIRHANVVAVYDLGLTSDRRPYIVMQHLEGQSLRTHLPPRAALDDVVPLAIDILRGLAAAHPLGIVHRDLKPDNVFVVAKPRPHAVIVDFGLAKLVADPRAPHLTITGESIGTPRYMAPEQIKGKRVDGRADLYAVGVMLYEVLAGEPPFQGESTFQLFDAHVNRAAPSLATARPDLPVAVCEVIDRALAKDPGERFADADAMRRALVAATSRQRSRRWPLIAIASAAMLVGAGVVVATWPSGASSASTNATSEGAKTDAPITVIHNMTIVGPMVFPRPGSAGARSSAEGDAKSIDNRPLPVQYQRGLDIIADNLANRRYAHADVLRMVCPIDQLFRQKVTIPDDTYRRYLSRMYTLLARQAGPDLATACAR